MPLCIPPPAVFCIAVVLCVQVESQAVSFPLPTLKLDPAVNASDIVMFSTVKLWCTIPNSAPFPVSVFISPADNTTENLEPLQNFQNIRRASSLDFNILMKPEMERPLACWYTSTNTKKSSGLSNSVDLVISSVPRPFMFLSPSAIFGVGGNYSAQCNIPSDQLKNVTLSLYVRQLPLSPGNENFTYIGSRALLPEDVGAKIQQTNVNSSAEFICKMEVFYKGKVFMSLSSPMAAIPDELPAAVYSTARQSTSCAGYLLLRVKEVWSPICFNNNDPINEENLANVVCREVKCGHALTWNKDTAASQSFLGTPKCTGKENRVAECPIFNLTYCERELFYIICSDALPPPKLSTNHGTKPWVYIKSEETAKLRCALESSSMGQDERIYLTITSGGQTVTSSRIRSEFSGNVWSIEYEVKEGEYACFASAGLNNAKTQNSNSIHIYIYNPPPAGAVAAAVITSVLGAAILIYICVCRTRKEVVLSEPAGGVCSSNIEILEPVSVTPPQCS